MTDFFSYSQKEAYAEKDGNSDLCCCEYIDQENHRFHIIACCCNCEGFDKTFTDWITCRPVNQSHQRNMLLTFQDRLRIPWRGGAKQVTFGSIIPIFAIPLLISLAAINAYTCIVIFLACTIIMCYVYYYAQRNSLRTRFFSIWVVSSLVCLTLLFELTVPLLEVLPEENWALAALSLASLICFHQTYKRAILNHVDQNGGTNSGLLDVTDANMSEEEEIVQTALLLEHDLEVNSNQRNICSICGKCVPSRTAHCSVCNACIKRHDHHSYWLDCCIGESNHRFYVFGLVFGILALTLGADLTLTAVCHPFLVANILGLQILLPDDCSEVFDMYELGLAFVIAVYALLIAAYSTVILVRQIYFISRGVTLNECKRGLHGNNKTLKYNWKNFIF
ncbi:palmitoyltransferase ZDHHC23-B isoform X1 [Anastrepha ludens]|uniref:palmitoyltransferase ZDHHC23-B isoform X1 n=2 Tax=Anastrepha ludens TaxID=28586 RepID=UPI0023B174AA|nr:palmitoyltransferase ZDHHC23-B isoform X1 [Anastrepha ludens]XP_053957341.1 palmitoyltransferase ZDHHC23-B isoform X1 [Anastrepha ludens]